MWHSVQRPREKGTYRDSSENKILYARSAAKVHGVVGSGAAAVSILLGHHPDLYAVPLLDLHCPVRSVPGFIVQSVAGPLLICLTDVAKGSTVRLQLCHPFLTVPRDIADDHIVMTGRRTVLRVLKPVASQLCAPLAAIPGEIVCCSRLRGPGTPAM